MNKLDPVIALMLLCGKAYAETSMPPLGKEIAEGISNEYAACSAYYSITAVSLECAGAVDAAAIADDLADQAFNYSYQAASAVRSKEMASEVAESRVSLHLQEMTIEAQGDMSDVSMLANKYDSRCQKALENPAGFVDEVSLEIGKMVSE